MRNFLVLALVVSLLPSFCKAAATFSFAAFVTCRSAKMSAPHDEHVPAEVFNTCDDKVYVWAELNNVSGVGQVEMKLYWPNGSYCGTEKQTINETNGVADWWRMAAWWQIKGDHPAEMPSRWRLDLVVDGSCIRTIYFDINGPALVSNSNSNSPCFAPLSNAGERFAVQNARTYVIEESSDMVRWTGIQTNDLPDTIIKESGKGSVVLRLTTGKADSHSYVLESCGDSSKWTPIQTNLFPHVEVPSAGVRNAYYYRVVIPSH